MLFYFRSVFAHGPIFQSAILIAIIALGWVRPTEKLPNAVGRLKGMLQLSVRFQCITILPPHLTPRQVTDGFQISDHELHGPLGHSDSHGDFAQGLIRMRVQIEQYLRMVGE